MSDHDELLALAKRIVAGHVNLPYNEKEVALAQWAIDLHAENEQYKARNEGLGKALDDMQARLEQTIKSAQATAARADRAEARATDLHAEIERLRGGKEAIVNIAWLTARADSAEAKLAKAYEALVTVRNDPESGPGGWGPDVTMQPILDEAIAAIEEESQP